MSKKPTQNKINIKKPVQKADKYLSAEKLLKEKELADLKKCGEELKQVLDKYDCTFLEKGFFEGNYIQIQRILIKKPKTSE